MPQALAPALDGRWEARVLDSGSVRVLATGSLAPLSLPTTLRADGKQSGLAALLSAWMYDNAPRAIVHPPDLLCITVPQVLRPFCG